MFKYKIKDEKELQILEIVKKVCENEKSEVLIDPTNFNTFLRNKEMHYDIVILPSSVIITNSVFSIRKSFKDKFLSILKEVAFERANKDRQLILEEILKREKEMLEKMTNSLSL